MEDQLYLEEVIQPQYNKELLLYQANELVRSKQDTLTLLEAKLVRLAIAQVLKEDTDFRTYEIDIISLAKLLKMDKQNVYHEMDILTDDLMRKIIRIKDKEDRKNYLKIHWVDTVKYKNGIITFKLSAELKPYLLGLQELFSLYSYEDVIELSTEKSIRLYELLVSYQNMRFRNIQNNSYNGIELERNEVIFTIDYLKEFFNCEKRYKKNNDFIRYVIDNNVNRINKDTILRVSYRTIQDETNSKKIKYIVFQFHSMGEIDTDE